MCAECVTQHNQRAGQQFVCAEHQPWIVEVVDVEGGLVAEEQLPRQLDVQAVKSHS